MYIQEKQAKWKQERPLFEAAFIHSHLLPFFNFNEHTGDYEIKSEFAEDEDRKLAYEILNTGWAMWLRAKRDAKGQAVPEGFVLVPHGVLDLTRFMCKTWSEIDKFVYKNCSDIGQYPVIQGTRNQLNLSRIGEQQINANEINKGVNWLLEAAQEPIND